jgi:hypothetical protein
MKRVVNNNARSAHVLVATTEKLVSLVNVLSVLTLHVLVIMQMKREVNSSVHSVHNVLVSNKTVKCQESQDQSAHVLRDTTQMLSIA